MNRLDQTFGRLKAKGEKALITYIMAGDPSLQETEQLVLELERAGADIIELGVPFSDPIADGPVIQQAAERGLQSGTSLRRILESVTRLRAMTQIPIVLMAYYNNIHAFGEADFCSKAAVAGVDGLIVPDMPPDEGTASRRAYVAKESGGFVYYVSITGITGAKLNDMAGVRDNVAKIRKHTKTPVAVGFGVATPEDAARIAETADGVIVGSAIVRRVGEHGQDGRLVHEVGSFVRSLKAAMQPG
ncbi:MAG: tryptophan synthase subunit alpha [Nitrospira sp. NTP1]|nr:tryptophan synthase subunit alpha [Nitrospira sp. NTP1]